LTASDAVIRGALGGAARRTSAVSGEMPGFFAITGLGRMQVNDDLTQFLSPSNVVLYRQLASATTDARERAELIRRLAKNEADLKRSNAAKEKNK
jgi:hypothetical protein